jgi:hypothetical protein
MMPGKPSVGLRMASVARRWGTWTLPLAVGGAVAAVWLSCSAPPKGALVLAVSTDMQAPKDIDLVSVYITSNGAPKFDYLGRVRPDGSVSIPATLAVVEPDAPNVQIRIRITAFKSQPDGSAHARVLRDVLTTVPHQHVSLLRIPLSFLDDGSANGTLPATLVPSAGGVPEGDTMYDPTTPGALTTACDFTKNLTSVNGTCVDSRIDPSTLPSYDDTQVFGDGGMLTSGAPATCYDVARCLGGASPVAGLDTTTCSFTTSVPAAQLDLALVTPGTGACIAAGQCIVPLQDDPAEGWTLSSGRVALPAGVCTQIGKGASLVQVIGSPCGPLTPDEPICQPATAAPDAGVDATVDAGCVTDGGVMGSLCGATCVDLTSDPSNCGYCAHGCGGGGCAAGACQPIVLTPIEHIPWSISVQSGTIYWIEQDSNYHILHSMPVGGGPVATLYAAPPQPYDPTAPENDLVVDPTGVYFGGFADIVGVGLDGGNPVILGQNNPWPQGMAVDNSNVYWATQGQCPFPYDGGVCQTGFVYQAPKNGNGPVTTLASGEMAPASVAVMGSTVYYISDGPGDGTSSAVVRSVPVGGGPVTTLASNIQALFNLGGNNPCSNCMGVDPTGVYFTTWDGKSTGALMKVPLDGGTPVMLAPLGSALGLALDSTGAYVADHRAATVVRVPLDGGAPLVVVPASNLPFYLNAADPWTIAVDQTNIYYTAFNCPTDGGECFGQVMQVAKP